MVSISDTLEWRRAHPGAIIGVLELSGVDNTRPSSALNERKRTAEARLRQQYAGFKRSDFVALPVMAAYTHYYKRFGNTYHVLQQVESIVSKGRRLPDVSPLVDANFTAEVETLVLTAGHDVDRLRGDLRIDVSRDGEGFTQMNGTPRAVTPGDMVMRDADGICCSILYGQDNRSPVSATTSRVLYVAYAPPGVGADAVQGHLRAVEANVRLGTPAAVTEQMRVIVA